MKRSCLLLSVMLLLGACTSQVVENIPLPEHPRPDFERPQWENLNGYWNFGFEENNLDQRILVPFPWGSALSEVEDKGDIAWYSREITIPRSWKGKRVFLVVGASDWKTEVWLNGESLGYHEGGYTPFEFELKDVKPGVPYPLVLKVDDTYSEAHLYGKQGYGNARGIWQTVYLEARGYNFIKSLHFTPDIDASNVKVDVALDYPAEEIGSFRLAFHTGGQPDFEAPIEEGAQQMSYVVPIENQHLWDLEDPFLYEVTASICSIDKVVDQVNSYWGQRKVGVAKLPGTDYSYVALNNKPLYLQLTLDQSYHPEGFYTFPSDEFMRNEIEISKKLGLNGNRIHIKVEVPRKLYWADKLGLLIMADTPNFWGAPTEEAKADWEHCFRGQIERDYNHPSIFAWVNFNESWGLHTNGEYKPETQEWVRAMHRLTKQLDPSRLAEDNSACLRDHVETDINSWHAYKRGFLWNEEIELYEKNTFPGSHFNFIGDNVQDGAPMINSECGDVWGYDGSSGDVDFTWDYHIMMDAFRRHPGCAGWLYTEHHDVINEWNGYVQYDRTPKIDGLGDLVPGMTLVDFHSPYYIAPDRYLYSEVRGGEVVEVPFVASFMTDENPGGLTLETELVGWNTLGDFASFSNDSQPVAFEPYMNCRAGKVRVAIPEEKGLYLLRFILKKADGTVLHRNFTTFRVKKGTGPEGVRVVSFPVDSYTAQEWSNGHSSVMDGLKVNGFGKGYFEYKVKLPKDIDLDKVASAQLIFEASSRQIFGKDVEGNDIQGDFMLGGGTYDHCKSPNSFAMTDDEPWPSTVLVTIEGYDLQPATVLEDCPADHRGILSWGAQRNERKLHEAGTYGQLVKVDLPVDQAKGMDLSTVTVRFSVPSGNGGLSLFGQDFGRYPMDPTFVFKMK